MLESLDALQPSRSFEMFEIRSFFSFGGDRTWKEQLAVMVNVQRGQSRAGMWMGWMHITRPPLYLVLLVGMCGNILIPTNYPLRAALNRAAVSNYTMNSGHWLLGPESLAFRTNALLGSRASRAAFLFAFVSCCSSPLAHNCVRLDEQ